MKWLLPLLFLSCSLFGQANTGTQAGTLPPASTGITIPGSNGQLLYNDGGSLGASSQLMFDKISGRTIFQNSILPAFNPTTAFSNWRAIPLLPGVDPFQAWGVFVSTSTTGQIQMLCDGSGSPKRAFRSTDRGNTWTPVGPSNSAIGGCAMSRDGKYWTLLQQSSPFTIHRSIDGGNTFSTVSAGSPGPTFGWAFASMSADGKYQYLGNYDDMTIGAIQRSTDYGATWTAVAVDATATTREIYDISTSDDGKYVLAADGNQGDLFRSTDYGATWTTITPAGKRGNSVGISGNGQYQILITYAGVSNFLHRSTDYGATWSSGMSIPGINAEPSSTTDGKYWFFGTTDVVYYSTDYASTLTSAPAPGTPGNGYSHATISPDGSTIIQLTSGNYNITGYASVATLDIPGGGTPRSGGIMNTQYSISNATFEASLLTNGTGPGLPGFPGFKVAPNTLFNGTNIRIRARGTFAAVSSPTINFRLKSGDGTTTVLDTGAVTLSITGTHSWKLEADCTVETIAVSGLETCVGIFTYFSATTTPITMELLPITTTVNTSGTPTHDITAQWGTANSSNIVKALSATMEIVN